MTIAIIIIVLLLSGVSLYTSINGEDGSGPFIIAIIMIFCGGMLYEADNKKNKQQAVDLPEEYRQLSHNSARLDTVLAFYDNDTVYIQFKPE